MEYGKKLLFIRKFNRETYKFYENSYPHGNYYSVETPENSFGYPDTVLFTSAGKAYTQWRYLPSWILQAIEKAFVKRGYNLCW